MHYVIKCSVSYVITHYDADRESRSDCVIGPEAYVYVSLNTSVLYGAASSELKIRSNWVMTQGKTTEYSSAKAQSVCNQFHCILSNSTSVSAGNDRTKPGYI
jgi:hypothetical protein